MGRHIGLIAIAAVPVVEVGCPAQGLGRCQREWTAWELVQLDEVSDE